MKRKKAKVKVSGKLEVKLGEATILLDFGEKE